MSEMSPPKAKRSRKKLIFLIAAAVLVVAVASAMVVSRKRVKPIPVSTEKAVRKTITALVTATGKIQPEVEVKISPEVAGEIVEIPVKEGQVVRKGDLLLRIKPDAYRAQVEEQEAALSGARAASVQHRAELSQAQNDFKRASSLFQKSLLSEADRNAAQTKDEIARSALNSSLFDIQRAVIAT